MFKVNLSSRFHYYLGARVLIVIVFIELIQGFVYSSSYCSFIRIGFIAYCELLVYKTFRTYTLDI